MSKIYSNFNMVSFDFSLNLFVVVDIAGMLVSRTLTMRHGLKTWATTKSILGMHGLTLPLLAMPIKLLVTQ